MMADDLWFSLNPGEIYHPAFDVTKQENKIRDAILTQTLKTAWNEYAEVVMLQRVINLGLKM